MLLNRRSVCLLRGHVGSSCLNTGGPLHHRRLPLIKRPWQERESDGSLTAHTFQGAEHYPDMVFTANAAVIRGRRAYLANFFHAERKGERYFFERWFGDNGFECVGSLEIPFEGKDCCDRRRKGRK